MFIYAIVNRETLKIYIGQHKGNNLRKYLQTKISDATHHAYQGSSHLFNAMAKYPKDVWSIHPLVSGIENKKELDETEQLLIYALKSQHPDVGYNICRGGEGHTGPLSSETIEKIRQRIQASWDRYSPEERAARGKIVGDAQRGVSKPEGFGETIRQALTGRQWTPEQREKIPQSIKTAISEGRMHVHQFTSEEMERAHNVASEKLRGVSRSPEAMSGCRTPESRAKVSAALRGRTISPEQRAKIAARKKAWWAAHPNHKFPLDRNAKIAQTMKGRTPTMALAVLADIRKRGE